MDEQKKTPLLFTVMPLLDKNRSVEAYLARSHWTSRLLARQRSALLDVVSDVGPAVFSLSKPLLVPVTEAQLRYGRLPPADNCLVLLLDRNFAATPENNKLLAGYAGLGYRFALQNGEDRELLKGSEFLLLSAQEMGHPERKALLRSYKRSFRQLRLIAFPVDTPEEFESAAGDGCDLFCGKFYTLLQPGTQSTMTPIKVNLVSLLNMVMRSEDFEFSDVEEVVRRDPALTVSLLRFINSPYLGVRHRVHSIRQAVTLLGQEEVRKWATAAVLRSLGTDRPGEITRASLIWAKLAENFAPAFRLQEEAPSLFLMGLFALLDVMLGIGMSEALEMVSISDSIRDALLGRPGPYLDVLRFLRAHESADWKAVDAAVGAMGLDVAQIQRAYVEAVGWYSEFITRPAKPRRE